MICCLPHKQEPRPSGDQARRKPFWKLQVLRLTHKQKQRPSGDQPRRGGSKYCACHADRSRGPAATRRVASLSEGSKFFLLASQLVFLEALSTVKYCACHTDRSRGPAATRRATDPSRGSRYCACHTNRSRGPADTRHATDPSLFFAQAPFGPGGLVAECIEP